MHHLHLPFFPVAAAAMSERNGPGPPAAARPRPPQAAPGLFARPSGLPWFPAVSLDGATRGDRDEGAGGWTTPMSLCPEH